MGDWGDGEMGRVDREDVWLIIHALQILSGNSL